MRDARFSAPFCVIGAPDLRPMSMVENGGSDRCEGESALKRRRLGERRRRPAMDLDLGDEEQALTDEVLIDRAAQGDEPAFHELYRRHHELAWRVARTTAGADDEAMAAVVDAFLQLPGLDLPDLQVPGTTPGPGAADAFSQDGGAPRTARAVLAAAARDAALERGLRRRSMRHPTGRQLVSADSGDDDEPVIDLSSESDRSDGELLQSLRRVVNPPPPELWALVHVAWNDRIPQEWDALPLARRVVAQLP
ncbi:MAG TPA: hypothetical protein VI916_00510 [Acidimicrobiia bacterium]|nr:hypothetical protein [Acidimicrobiia bacterium]